MLNAVHANVLRVAHAEKKKNSEVTQLLVLFFLVYFIRPSEQTHSQVRIRKNP